MRTRRSRTRTAPHSGHLFAICLMTARCCSTLQQVAHAAEQALRSLQVTDKERNAILEAFRCAFSLRTRTRILPCASLVGANALTYTAVHCKPETDGHLLWHHVQVCRYKEARMAAAVDAAIARADAVVEAAAAENADAGPIPFTRCTCLPVCFDFDFRTSIAADAVVQEARPPMRGPCVSPGACACHDSGFHRVTGQRRQDG